MKKSLLLRAEDCGSSPMIKRPRFGLVAEPPSPLSPIQANAISVPTPSGQCPSANALRYALSPSPTTTTGTNTNNDKSASARSFPGALLFASSPTAHSPSAAATTTGATKSDKEQSCADALIAAANGMSTCRSMSVTVPTKAATKEKNNGPAKATASLPLNIDTNDDRTCKCTKSKCLKLYCECFSGGVACGADCGCKNCENIEGTFERNEAIEAAIKKNSDCFATKRQTRAEKRAVLKSSSASNGQALSTQCRCKRSRCIKLYCECFSAGNHCGAGCGCHECMNKVTRSTDTDGNDSDADPIFP